MGDSGFDIVFLSYVVSGDVAPRTIKSWCSSEIVQHILTWVDLGDPIDRVVISIGDVFAWTSHLQLHRDLNAKFSRVCWSRIRLTPFSSFVNAGTVAPTKDRLLSYPQCTVPRPSSTSTQVQSQVCNSEYSFSLCVWRGIWSIVCTNYTIQLFELLLIYTHVSPTSDNFNHLDMSQPDKTITCNFTFAT